MNRNGLFGRRSRRQPAGADRRGAAGGFSGLNAAGKRGLLPVLLPLAVGAVLYCLRFIPGLPDAAVLVLTTIAFLVGGFGVFRGAVHALRHGHFFHEDVLFALAGIGALCTGHPLEALLMMAFVQAGRSVQKILSESVQASARRLLDLRVEQVRIQTADGLKTVETASLRPGDAFMVFAGETIALDGVILSGETRVDASAIGGAARPVSAGPGSPVQAGSVNLSGAISVRVTHKSGASKADRLLYFAQQAEESAHQTGAGAMTAARRYAAAALVLAVLLSIFVPLLFKASYTVWIHRALTLLVVCCPFAWTGGVPLCYFAGLYAAPRRGILFKKAESIENLAQARCVALEKSGALQTQEISVQELRPAPGVSRQHLLAFAVYAQSGAHSPAAQAIARYAGVHPDERMIAESADTGGIGHVVTLTNGQRIAAGSAALMRAQGVAQPLDEPEASALHICAAGRYCGCIVFTGAVQDDAKKSIDALYEAGVDKCILLTGESKAAAASVAADLGLTEAFTSCLPAEKLRVLETYKRKFRTRGGGTVVYAGNGASDEAVLEAADVGIALDALDLADTPAAADVLTGSSALGQIALAIRYAQHVRLTANACIAFSILVKSILLVFGLTGVIPVWAAAFCDLAASTLTGLGGIYLLRK